MSSSLSFAIFTKFEDFECLLDRPEKFQINLKTEA